MKRLVRNLTVSAVTHDTVGMRNESRDNTTQHDTWRYSYTHGVRSQLIPQQTEEGGFSLVIFESSVLFMVH